MIIEERDPGHGSERGVEGTPDTLRRRTRAREAVAGFGRGARREAVFAGGYALLWLLAALASGAVGYLPAGVRFAALWLTPPRRWPAFALAEAAAGAVLAAAGLLPGPADWLLSTLVPWSGCALAIRWIRPRGVYAAPESPARMGTTLLAMLLAAAIEALARYFTLTFLFTPPSVALLQGLVASYNGMLALAPLAFQLFQPAAQRQQRRRVLLDLLRLVVPLLALLALLLYWHAPASLYAGSLALLPMMLMAFRHGWRGAAWALALTSAALQLAWLGGAPGAGAETLPLFLALIGSVALLLGSAIGSLLRANAALIERNRMDQAANAQLAAQTEALGDLSRRLVRAREDEQRRLAHELHDELGQSVAALGTRLSLLLRRTDDAELLASLHAQRELVQRVQASIREVLQGLRPAVLDRFGLEAALREGPVQRMLADAGIGYEASFSGPVDKVSADTGSAVYRICQEAATNCVRHSRARNFRVRLDVAPAWAGDLEVHLRIEDDGCGFDAAAVDAASLGGGLRGIRDRVMAIAGDYRCESSAEGTRHLVWFVDRAARA
jgi:two-component system, NarL family, sensor histidine kinase FusK